MAEEGDDISNVQIPEEEGNTAPEQKKGKPVQSNEIFIYTKPLFCVEQEAPAAAPAPATTASPISHHDIDTSKLKKPLSPAVLNLVLRHGIKDVGSIKASGNAGRILKGDVLAHLGLIAPKPAPKATFSIAPPRDQIVFAKVNI